MPDYPITFETDNVRFILKLIPCLPDLQQYSNTQSEAEPLSIGLVQS